jgi:hypothetical protein
MSTAEKEVGCEDVNWIQPTQGVPVAGCANTAVTFSVL